METSRVCSGPCAARTRCSFAIPDAVKGGGTPTKQLHQYETERESVGDLDNAINGSVADAHIDPQDRFVPPRLDPIQYFGARFTRGEAVPPRLDPIQYVGARFTRGEAVPEEYHLCWSRRCTKTRNVADCPFPGRKEYPHGRMDGKKQAKPNSTV